jgi:glycosyltransferase involved in cell wall biosynthesis
MTISVLIAAYRAAAFLPAALASIAAQTHPDWDLVVVEDGSRDATESLVRDFAVRHPGHKVHYENLGENRGVAAARNRLLDLAPGDAVAFLDADDEWRPTHLEDLSAALTAGAALAFSGIALWDGDHHRPIGDYLPPSDFLAQPRRSLFDRSFIQTSSCVALPRATIARAGRIDESLRIGEDRDYWFRCLAGGGRLTCTGKITCRYTKHEGSSMTKTLRVASDTVAFYRKHQRAEDIPTVLRRARLAEALTIHGRLLRAADPRTAAHAFGESLRLAPWRLDRVPWWLASRMAARKLSTA